MRWDPDTPCAFLGVRLSPALQAQRFPGLGGPGPALPRSGWLSPGAGGRQCRGQHGLRAALSVQPGLGWELHTGLTVSVSRCGGPSSPPAPLASAGKVRNDQAEMTQPCLRDAGQCLKPLSDLAEKEALSDNIGLGCP